MRVLTVHNSYLLRAGEDEAVAAETALLQSHGCEVVPFVQANERVAEIGRLATALRATWSHETYRSVRALLRARRFDVVHVHNFFPLVSPAVHFAAKAEGIPSIQTLHNYRLVCAAATLYRAGRPCRLCVDSVVPWPAIVHRCYRGSAAGSAAVAVMQTAHRRIGTWARKVDLFIALTEASRRQFVGFGIAPDRLVVKPNFMPSAPEPGSGKGGYALFVGRLAPEKGVRTLLRAWATLAGTLPLRIIGEGALEPEVRAAAAARPDIAWLGQRPVEAVYSAMADAAMLIFPSEWLEGFPRVLVEALAIGTPVIAARIGAAEEIVHDGRTGLFFRPGDADDLARKVRFLAGDGEAAASMRHHARAEYESKYTAEQNWLRLRAIYERAMAGTGASERKIFP